MKTSLVLFCVLVLLIQGCRRSEPAAIPPPAPAGSAPAIASNSPSAAQPAAVVTPPSPSAPPAPADSEADRIQPLSLATKYDTPAEHFDRIEKYPWRYVARGQREFGNVPVNIGGLICLWGASNAKGGLNFPEESRGIPVSRKFSALYVYHTAFSSSPINTPIAEMVFRYDDDTSETNVIRYGEHVWDWSQKRGDPDDVNDPKSRMVWRGTNWMSKSTPLSRLRFFITEFPNPRPETRVMSIDLFSTKSRTAACVLAMTCGPTNLMREDLTHLDH